MKSGTMTFLEFAYEVLSKTKMAMTPEEIWQSSGEKLKSQIKTTGKTPLLTLASRLYTDVKADDSKFVTMGSRPKRFAVKGIDVSSNQQAPTVTPVTSPQKSSFLEKDLHPLLVWFARQQFSAWCKTISHSQSTKLSGGKSNQWLHPDIVGFTLLTKSWERPVADLLRTTGASATKLYSFELKRSLEFATLREHFFQAVSNSSWANAGYLVVVELPINKPDFMEELERLSQSFGIGVIKLDLDSLEEESRIIFPAQEKKEVDWETINRIAEINPDFKEFLILVRESSDIHKIVNETTFDKVNKDSDEVIAYALSLTKK